MNCEKCHRPMVLVHDAVERETRFSLYECQCGNKLLDRRPAPPGTASAQAHDRLAASSSSSASSSHHD
jgi:hypothetical protein